jgi:transposase-like protein
MQSTSSTTSEPFSSSDSSIIRAGSDGRLRFTPAQRQELLDAFDRSGLSAMAFARSHGVCYQTFIAWQRKRRAEATIAPTHSGPAFAEVLVADRQPARPGAALRVILPCGSTIEIPSRAALPLAVELLTFLRRPC